MTIFESVSIIVAVFALLISASAVYYNSLQTKKATEALQLQQNLSRGDAVMHFTSRFFNLLEQGEPLKKIDDPDWAYQFWSLQATEFYFFHHGILPAFMYSLWMIDLAKLYSCANGQAIRDSHKSYLDTYSLNYSGMIGFFNQIYEIARTSGDDNLRNKEIANFIESWIVENSKNKL